ncbi:hypothetical protein FGO68_gene6917 [Halteria grandinella]|uniref:Uncharacterized protein n=1 Tax=Halteria grandinella TaxID=5974 RepID=A0A8J8TB68_HALGN|nr:hypothetical protein FGO68_gene6917 [Halteria grandinella]
MSTFSNNESPFAAHHQEHPIDGVIVMQRRPKHQKKNSLLKSMQRTTQQQYFQEGDGIRGSEIRHQDSSIAPRLFKRVGKLKVRNNFVSGMDQEPVIPRLEQPIEQIHNLTIELSARTSEGESTG